MVLSVPKSADIPIVILSGRYIGTRTQISLRLLELLPEQTSSVAEAATSPTTSSTPSSGMNVNATPFVPQSTGSISATPPSLGMNVDATPFVPQSTTPPLTQFSSWSAPTATSLAQALPNIDAEQYTAAHKDGRTREEFRKWWSSPNFPNHNIEMMVFIDNWRWAIVHIKWKDRLGPGRDNVQMATFKAADGSSIYGGNIWRGLAYDLLLTKALEFAKDYPPPS